jgi:hypothetical protein
MADVDTNINLDVEGNLPILVAEDGVVVTPVAFTANGDNDTETLVITPRGPCHKMVVIINEVGNGGTMTVNCEAGSFWAGQAMNKVDVESETSKAFVFEAAKHYGNEGLGVVDADEAKIQVSVAPATDQKLVSDHGATWQVFQLP